MNTGGPTELNRRALHILVGIVVTASVIGFFAGTRHALEPTRQTVVASTTAAAPGGPLRPAPSYTDLRTYGPIVNNAGVPTDLQTLAAKIPDRMQPVEQQLDARSPSVEARMAMRAYDGAPPTIPHAIDQTGAPACLACHGEGIQLGGRVAPKMSHTLLTSCTQCHVVQGFPFPSGTEKLEPEMPANTFLGLASPTSGERAWQGAPPTIPHTTAMRTDCMSCHGPSGRAGLRTSHPWRQSCTQCHAPSAVLDQRPSSLP